MGQERGPFLKEIFSLKNGTRIQANGSILSHNFGVFFLKGCISLKKTDLAPPLERERVQALSKARVYLSSENKQKLLCMGRTYTAISLYLLNSFHVIRILEVRVTVFFTNKTTL
jgi:hypothetical protein